MVPSLSLDFGPESIHPKREWRCDLEGVIAECIRRGEAQTRLEFLVSLGTARRKHLIQGTLQVVGICPNISAPIRIPNRSRVWTIDGGNNQANRIVCVIVTGNGFGPERFPGRVSFIVLHQIRPALPIGSQLTANDPKSCSFLVAVFAFPSARSIGDNSLDIPFIRVKEEPHQ